MIQTTLHNCFCQSRSKLSDWYCAKLARLEYPIYSSFDIRDAGFKIANVDGNLYPAGFNNICNTDQDYAGQIFHQFLKDHYGSKTHKILLVTEEHTNNPYYWDNVRVIRKLLENAGSEVLVAVAQPLSEPWNLTTAQGHSMQVQSAWPDRQMIQDFKPDIVISNNDFSDPHTDWWQAWEKSGLSQVMNPPRELGWYQRQKSRYFHFYNRLVEEFVALVDEDPFLMNVRTEVAPLHMENDEELQILADRADQMLVDLRQEYASRGIQQEPFLFVKNNAGTYGLAVIRVSQGREILEWNYKARKKMKAAKGGRIVEEVILQEGIPSRVQADGVTAEPVIYMIGSELGGGFLRSHAEKNSTESLNSPGAVYKRLCVTDLNVSLEGHPLENVYGWSARLGLLAIAQEAQEMKVRFSGWQQSGGQV